MNERVSDLTIIYYLFPPLGVLNEARHFPHGCAIGLSDTCAPGPDQLARVCHWLVRHLCVHAVPTIG
jgi:hypothetical protein